MPSPFRWMFMVNKQWRCLWYFPTTNHPEILNLTLLSISCTGIATASQCPTGISLHVLFSIFSSMGHFSPIFILISSAQNSFLFFLLCLRFATSIAFPRFYLNKVRVIHTLTWLFKNSGSFCQNTENPRHTVQYWVRTCYMHMLYGVRIRETISRPLKNFSDTDDFFLL